MVAARPSPDQGGRRSPTASYVADGRKAALAQMIPGQERYGAEGGTAAWWKDMTRRLLARAALEGRSIGLTGRGAAFGKS